MLISSAYKMGDQFAFYGGWNKNGDFSTLTDDTEMTSERTNSDITMGEREKMGYILVFHRKKLKLNV